MIPASAAAWAARVEAAAGPLAPLADSLASDLDRLLPDEHVLIPPEKARLTRHGGRCARDGTLLEFDPRSPRRHRCARCGAGYEGEDHYRWWIMGYQLWLAERAAHAAALWRLRGARGHRRVAESILLGLADRYATYPNVDNVLGPARVFFSTYLESIWLLQVIAAATMLGDDTADTVRDRIVEPSAALIASYNEGNSNRQVWNSAALAAAGVLLGRAVDLERAVSGRGGLVEQLRDGLLEDGTWYEGENYHLFAHRGLWYLVTIAEDAGIPLPPTLVRRFERAFAAPLRTALPDLTFPSRRDSHYGVSLRQWRIAESLELGLARQSGDHVLASGLQALYADAPPGDAARWRSTADAERNVPAARLTRADLGWKSLLHALPAVPDGSDGDWRASTLLPSQGIGVLRRDGGSVYIALDYGHHGGGHGHPDRLNLWLVRGGDRVLEDVGTGSYVDPTLFWYRSTLAHNAPLVNGRSQRMVDGALRAWDEGERAGWIDADVSLDRKVRIRRSVVAADGYLVDRLEWSSTEPATVDLPWHVDGDLHGAAWSPAHLDGGSEASDGFAWLHDTARATLAGPAIVSAGGIDAHIHVQGEHEWWRAVAPGPPGHPERPFLLVRCRGKGGIIVSVWSWRGAVTATSLTGDRVTVHLSGNVERHAPSGRGWRIDRANGDSIRLAGHRPTPSAEIPVLRPVRPGRRKPLTVDVGAAADRRDDASLRTGAGPGLLRFDLGEIHYRRTEASWTEAGSPRATVMITADHAGLRIEVTVVKTPTYFAPHLAENPLDNEPPDINSDGVQVHLSMPGSADPVLTWLLVPEPGRPVVRVTPTQGGAHPELTATWRERADGYRIDARISFDWTAATTDLGLDVIVNETAPGRERRRGQLVMSGARSEWAYLRGDRQDADRLIPIRVRRG